MAKLKGGVVFGGVGGGGRGSEADNITAQQQLSATTPINTFPGQRDIVSKTEREKKKIENEKCVAPVRREIKRNSGV